MWVFVLVENFLWIADEIVEFPLIKIVEIDQFVMLGSDSVVPCYEMAGAGGRLDHLVVVVERISPVSWF